MKIYYIYKISNGEFAGSGNTPIRNAIYNFTEVAPSHMDEDDTIFWDGTEWTDSSSDPHPTPDLAEYLPMPTVPESVTPRQIRLALIDRGIMPEQITAILEAIEDVTLRAKSLAEWEYALEIRRDDPLIDQLSSELNFTDTEVDNLFIEALSMN